MATGAGSKRTTPTMGDTDTPAEAKAERAAARAHATNVNSVGHAHPQKARTVGPDAGKSMPPKPARTSGSY